MLRPQLLLVGLGRAEWSFCFVVLLFTSTESFLMLEWILVLKIVLLVNIVLLGKLLWVEIELPVHLRRSLKIELRLGR